MAKKQAQPKRGRREPWLPQVALPVRWAALTIAALAGVAALASGARWLLDPQTLPVARVRIHSPLTQVSPEQLRRTVAPLVSEGFVQVDVERVRAAIEALPWVQEAAVRRGWPDALVIHVREQRAVARWRGGGLVNPQGAVFQPADAAGAELPLLGGPEGSGAELVERLGEVRRLLSPLGLEVRELTLSPRRAWSLRLNDGMAVMVGRDEPRERLLRLVKVYRQVVGPRAAEIERVDLRYTNGFAVRWREGYGPSPAV